MNRRQSISALGATAALMLMQSAAAETSAPTKRSPPPFDLLIQPATDCLLKGQNCLSYCIYQLGEGRKEMATVARTVNELLPLCEAALALASQHGKQLNGLVSLVISASDSCQTECRKFSQNHVQLKECADACATMINVGKQFQIELAEFEKANVR